MSCRPGLAEDVRPFPPGDVEPNRAAFQALFGSIAVIDTFAAARA